MSFGDNCNKFTDFSTRQEHTRLSGQSSVLKDFRVIASY